jgi:hypothetical protein
MTYYADNKEQFRERYQKNLEKVREYNRQYNAEHKQERRERNVKHIQAVYEGRAKPPRRYKKSGQHKQGMIPSYEPTVKGPVNLVTFTF